jgi:hypothetical protein
MLLLLYLLKPSLTPVQWKIPMTVIRRQAYGPDTGTVLGMSRWGGCEHVTGA